MSWLYRNRPRLRKNWYKVDVVNKDGNIIESFPCCYDCGNLYEQLNALYKLGGQAALDELFKRLEKEDL